MRRLRRKPGRKKQKKSKKKEKKKKKPRRKRAEKAAKKAEKAKEWEAVPGSSNTRKPYPGSSKRSSRGNSIFKFCIIKILLHLIKFLI